MKIRASKKLRIPFNRVGYLWILQKKGQNNPYSNGLEKLLNNSSSDVILSVVGNMKNGQLRMTTPKDQQDNQKPLSLVRGFTDKTLMLVMMPYDLNGQAELQQTLNNKLPEINNVSMRKKTII